jgi:hypothetical protein
MRRNGFRQSSGATRPIFAREFVLLSLLHVRLEQSKRSFKEAFYHP